MARSISRAAGWAALAWALGAVQARPAEAFCGFYVAGSSEQLTNKATRVAMMRSGTRTVLSMSNDYDGPAEDFAMVVPVPVVLQRENVRTLPQALFTRLETLTAPRLVEYWEQDPCAEPDEIARGSASEGGSGRGVPGAARGGAAHGVRVEAQFEVGEYDVVVLSATESTGLETWLRENRYNIPAGAAGALAPYVREQWKFFVARVDIERAERRPSGGVRLSPLRFHYDAPDFRLPVRLGLLNAGDAQDLIVYILHPRSRFEVANYANAFIPTNLDVADSARSNFGELYARLFDYTLEQAGGRAVVTEYAWATTSCDPCPTPPLNARDLATLGADVLSRADTEDDDADFANPRLRGMTVTRLHTRYNRATLTEDLIFREAPPVVGGREFVTNQRGRLEQGARASAYGNNFQARYAIRHRWPGPITCAHPRRGIWGGPPGGPRAPVTARDLAELPRGRIRLAQVVRTPIPPVVMGSAVGGSAPTPAPTAPPPAIRPAPEPRLPPGFTRPAAPGRRSEAPRPSRLAVLFTALTAGLVGLVFARRRPPR
jgi:hypothetical protein